MPNKTPEEDFKRFESFLEGMEDIEYEYWYNNEASQRQKDLADGIREELEEEEAFRHIEGYRGESFFK